MTPTCRDSGYLLRLLVSRFELLDLATHDVRRLAVPLLDLADELLALPGNDVHVVVGELAPLFPNLALELRPVALDRLRVHDRLRFDG